MLTLGLRLFPHTVVQENAGTAAYASRTHG
jgi:hypothetical protein